MYSITGPPGSGKSTQVEILANQGWQVIGAGSLLRQYAPSEILDNITKGNLANNDYTNQLIGQRIDQLRRQGISDNQLILDGYPRVLVQAQWLLQTYKAQLKTCLFLEASEEVLIKRLLLRGRTDDTQSSIKKRFQIYNQSMSEVIGYFQTLNIEITQINADQSIEAIAQEIKGVLSFAK
ncbi:MAG: nucleoside monophosphate kinase [Candidatus Saccharibacteria bacterium]|nr:nucleoside monophosphate kinase [Candidatus Saccharibacteria bacterium]MCY4088913.1 nucleoside monophosphate kinase [Candidatus Saccharibacteria bacterium]